MGFKGRQKPSTKIGEEAKKKDELHKNYSNNMKDAVQTFCGECDKAMYLSEVKDHIKSRHKLEFTEYNRIYKNPSAQLIKITYHKCKLCRKELVLDETKVIQHLKKCHSRTAFTEYKHRFLSEESTNGKGFVSTASALPSLKPQETFSRRAPWPECSSCGRNFKSNMHLKMHIRRDH